LAIAAITPMMEIQIDELDAPVLSLLTLPGIVHAGTTAPHSNLSSDKTRNPGTPRWRTQTI
jgi:hypothetical protein